MSRSKYYERVFGNKNFHLVTVSKPNGFYYQGESSNGKKVGRAFKIDGDTHRRLAKMYPAKIPPPAGFAHSGQRLVSDKKRNITRGWKAVDWQAHGFKTKRQGEDFYKVVKKYYPSDYHNFFSSLEAFSDLLKMREALKNKDEKLENILKNKLPDKVVDFYKRNKKNFKFDAREEETKYKNWGKNYTLRRNRAKLVVTDIYRYFNRIARNIQKLIYDFQMSHRNPIKAQIVTEVFFENPLKGDEEKRVLIHSNIQQATALTMERLFDGKENDVLYYPGSVRNAVNSIVQDIFKRIEKFTQAGSGWRVKNVGETYLNMVKFDPIKGKSWFPTPSFVAKKKAVVNIKNTDNKCFWYCMVFAMHEEEFNIHNLRDRGFSKKEYARFSRLYPHSDSDYPVYVQQSESNVDISKKLMDNIDKQEGIFQCNINVLIFEEGQNEVLPFRESKSSYHKTVNLLLMYNSVNNHYHFVYVRNISRLLSTQTATSYKTERHYCLRCLSNFNSVKSLDQHKELCSKNDVCLTKCVEESKCVMEFKGIQNQVSVPFYGTFDFEALNVPTNIKVSDRTVQTSEHVPCGSAFVIKNNINDTIEKTFLHRGQDTHVHFLTTLCDTWGDLVEKYYVGIKEMIMTDEDVENHRNATVCHICSKEGFASYDENAEHWNTKNKPHPQGKVKDHCHFTGKYRGAAHSKCNLNYKNQPTLNMFCHNLKGYDSHIIVKALQNTDKYKIEVIPLNKEKFLSITIRMRKTYVTPEGIEKTFRCQIILKDSYSFLSDSLDVLVKDLRMENLDDFHTLRAFLGNNPVMMELLTKKGVYPYEYMDSWARFEETQFPPVEKFLTMLSHETRCIDMLSEGKKAQLYENYNRGQEVYQKYECKNLGDYHDLYLWTDVYLLMDVFEKFRQTSLNNFGLDPCHYITLPMMAFDAMLKVTGVKLHLFTEKEKDMYLFCEQAKYGGISSVCSKRFSKANHHYLSDYEVNELKKFIIYGDANGLYSWAMSQKLPIDNYRWIEEVTLEEIIGDVDGDTGYFVEVDVHLPEELHDEQMDYPCFPENRVVQESELSDYQKKVREHIDDFTKDTVPKLMQTLYPKEKYIVHSKLLKKYVELGWVVDKIHRVLAFRQEAWLKPYIDLCMNNRAKAQNEFEKAFWKLCCNAVYGKTMENVRNRTDVVIINNEKEYVKTINSLRLKTLPYKINDNDVYIAENAVKTVKLNKPIPSGVAILNLAKELMYDFWYNVLKKKYGNRVSLLYTDTDSFIFEVQTDDWYADLKNDPEFLDYWDTSNFPKDHPLQSNKNKKVVGKFKDETGGVPITEVVCVRAKAYSLLLDNKKTNYKTEDTKNQKNTGKGVKKVVLERTPHDKYKDCVLHDFDREKITQKSEMNFIKSDKLHNLHCQKMTKVSLCALDTKRYICDDGVTQLPYGHKNCVY